MNTIYTKIALSLGAMFILLGCEKSDDFNVTDYLSAVTITDDNNKLRNNILVELKEMASVQVEYWKQGEDEHKLLTPVSESSMRHHEKMILLEAESTYDCRVKIMHDKAVVYSDVFSFVTRSLPENLSDFENQLPESDFRFDGYINVATKPDNSYLYLLNHAGKIVWYQNADDKSIGFSSFDPVHNTFQLILGQNPDRRFGGDEIRVIDLYGNTLLSKMRNELKNPDVHHDIKRLPNGDLIMINYVTDVFDLTAHGGSVTEEVSSDGLTIMDMGGTVKWEWSSFSVMNPADYSFIMDEGKNGRLSPREDLTHSNSISLDTDGNYLMTHNRLNQLWKIDSSTGELIYNLGLDGDIQLNEEGFTSGIHSSHINLDGEIMVLDNGKASKQSRAISYLVDESTKQASVVKNVKFPSELFSPNQASAFMVDSDHILFGSSVEKTMVITDMQGSPVWQFQTDLQFYRAYYINEINLNN